MEPLFLEFTIRAALLVGGTAIVMFAFRVMDAAAKHKIWTGVMLLMLMLPALNVWGPKASVRLLPAMRQVTRVGGFPLADDSSARILSPGTINLKAYRQTTQPSLWTWRNIFLGVYLLGLCALLLRLAIGTMSANRLVRRAVLQESRLTNSSCLVPITVGLLHSKCCLDA
jgi:hypothetical protein